MNAISMPEVEVRVACTGKSVSGVKGQDGMVIAGFMGTTHSLEATMIEMLFIDPLFMGEGLGTRFLEIADMLCPERKELRVDVNEDNTEAAGFYRARGFVRFGRSATDPFDRPYPILHLKKQLFCEELK